MCPSLSFFRVRNSYHKGVTRRDLASLLPLVAALPAVAADMAPSDSRVFHYSALPVKTSSNGNATRPVLKGQLPTGESVEVHETTLAPGQMPHPPHRHRHTEMMLIRTGSLEFILEHGTDTLGPGDIAWCASNQLHGLKNSGSEPANYFVVAIGSENS